METISYDEIKIEMIHVSASNVAQIGFHEEYQITAIEMLNGCLYYYLDTPKEEFEGLKNSPSIGSYLHRNYKGTYRYIRIK